MQRCQGPPGPSQEDPGKPLRTPGIDPWRTPKRWISIEGSVFKPTPAVKDHPGILPVSLRLRPQISSAALLNLFPQHVVRASKLAYFSRTQPLALPE